MPSKNLHVLMTADAKSVESALGRVEAGFKKLEASTAGLRAGLGAIVGGADPLDILKGTAENLLGSIPKIGPALQAGLNIGEAFFNKVRSTQHGMLEVGEQASALGADVKGFSTLRLASENAEALDQALFRLSNSITDAAIKGGDLDEVFQKLGLSSSELSALPLDESYLRTVDALNKVESSYLRTKLAQEIFGKSANLIKRDIEEGADKLRTLQKHFADQGLGLTEHDIATVKKADLEMKKFDATLESIWRTIAIRMSPAIADLGKDLQAMRGPKSEVASEEEMQRQADILQGKRVIGGLGRAWLKSATFRPAGAMNELFDAISAMGPNAAEGAINDVRQWNNAIKESEKNLQKLGESGPGWLMTIARAAHMGKEAFKELEKQSERDSRMWDEIFRDREKLIEKTETPLEKLNRQLFETQEILQLTKSSAELTDRALGGLVEEFVKLNAVQPSFSPALELGSAAEFGARVKLQAEATGGGDALDRLRDVMERQTQHNKDTAANTKKMAEAADKIGLINR